MKCEDIILTIKTIKIVYFVLLIRCNNIHGLLLGSQLEGTRTRKRNG